jgi:hypothetical protein
MLNPGEKGLTNTPPNSEGLSPTGSPSGDCLDSTGQIYARSETYNGAFAIMYSWYWPKDEPSQLESLFVSTKQVGLSIFSL